VFDEGGSIPVAHLRRDLHRDGLDLASLIGVSLGIAKSDKKWDKKHDLHWQVQVELARHRVSCHQGP